MLSELLVCSGPLSPFLGKGTTSSSLERGRSPRAVTGLAADSASKNSGCPVTLAFQTNDDFFKYIYVLDIVWNMYQKFFLV